MVGMERKTKYYVASLSGGKDSLAMVLLLIASGYPLTHVVFYDGGMEFSCIYRIIEKIRPIIENYGVKLIVLKPEREFWLDMFIKPINEGTEKEHFGYDWCGGKCRWKTSDKISAINKFLDSLDGDYTQYIGIAADEPSRIKEEKGKIYPLKDWGLTERDCLNYCWQYGWHWWEKSTDDIGYIDLYSILDRVSCWCCANKNIKELRNIYHYLPTYWGYLKGMQSRIDRPFHGGMSIFDYEKRFKLEDAQMVFDFCKTEPSLMTVKVLERM